MVTYSIHAKQKTHKEPSPKPFALSVILVIGLALLAGSMLIAHKHSLSGVQARIFYDFDNLPNSYRKLGEAVTEGLGAAYPIAACVLISAACKKFRLAWRFLVTAGGAFVLAYIVKKVVNEPRPIVMLKGHLHQRVVETGPGFPSGHEAAATALALTLWFILPKKWRFIPVIWILAVAWSRLYLGVHTPADVIGGFACGLIAVCVVRLLPRFIARPLRLDDSL